MEEGLDRDREGMTNQPETYQLADQDGFNGGWGAEKGKISVAIPNGNEQDALKALERKLKRTKKNDR